MSITISNTSGLPDGYYQNGMDIGSKFYVKPLPYITNSLTFNGTNQKCVLSSSTYYDTTELSNGGTIEAWIKVPVSNSTTNYQGIIVKAETYGIYIYQNKITVYNWGTATGITAGNNQYSQLMNDNQWHHIALIFKPNEVNGSSIYIDGQLKMSFSIAYTINTSELTIGSSYASQYFNGSISFVRIWNTIKAASFINQYYNQYINPADYPDLIGLYSFSEGSGVGIANSSLKNSYAFTTIGSPTWSTAYPPIFNSTTSLVINNNPVVLSNTSIINNLFSSAGISPYGIYDAKDWNVVTNVLPEARGQTTKNVTSTGIITYSFSSGNGATASIPSISGGTNSTLTWTTGSIPANGFTICSITRYNGANTSSGILVNTTGSADYSQLLVQGHWVNKGGRFFNCGAWVTDIYSLSTPSTITNWLVSCNRNSNVGQVSKNAIMNGQSLGITSNTLTPSGVLTINNTVNNLAIPANQRTSDWSFSYLVIYENRLTDAQMDTISSKLNNYLVTGSMT